MASSSSRGRSISPFNHRKPSSPYSSTSSSSSFMNGRLMPRSSSSTATSFFGSGTGVSSKSANPSRNRSNSDFSRGYGDRTPVSYQSTDELITEPVDVSRAGESILVTVRFRPLSEREYHKGDEIAWSPDGDKTVRNEYNAATAFAFDRVFGPDTCTQEVYEVAARPVVKAAMEGINGTVFAYGVTSSGKTHTMHGDQNAPGIIPLAIRDVFSIIQDTPGCEFLLRVSYLEIYNEVINDLLDPTGQNLRVREDSQGTYVEGIKEEVVLSPGHALSFIAAGEEHRHVGSNNFNLFSSRSHTIFTLMIESSAHGDEYDGVIFSQLNLIDLAGSESSKTETTGLRRKEGSYINKSLLTLGTVIGKLSEGKASHVPYRDSKLTRLLQSSLSGRGHVSLICTVTPASSNMEETHNTLKFASRAKRVEIYASRNKIIDEKSLIKKYQNEISSLKQELDQLRRGMLVGVNHEELITLKQQLEEGQVKMQSRLEEEEDAKAALLSRIQKLTKLILVSSKNSIPGSRFSSEDDKLNGFMPIDSKNQRDASSETSDFKHGRSSSKLNDDISQAGSVIIDSTQAGEIVNGSKLSIGAVSLSDQMDLLVEQVKMLAGEIALSMSTLKRMIEQSVNDPENSKTRTEIQSLERDIELKREQMRILEQRIVESGEVSISSASLVEMQQTLMKLMTQCSETGFELEIKSADNRILQEELQNKCLENKELRETISNLEQQLAAVKLEKLYPSSEQGLSDKYIDDFEKKIQLQDIENGKLKLELVQSIEESSGLRLQNQKLSEEASYAKELASAAAVELKNLAGEVTKLSIQNSKLEKELLAARQAINSRSSIAQNGNVRHRKHGENLWQGRRGRVSDRESEVPGVVRDGFGTWDLDTEDLKAELLARKQREAALEATLVEKEILEDEYRKKVEEGKKREAALENDLANMWVLVAQLRRKNGAMQDVKTATERQNVGGDNMNDPEMCDSEYNNPILDDGQSEDHATAVDAILKEDPLVACSKASMPEMKEKDHTYVGNADANSHVCKVCFESPTSAMLLPCRHFCLCKSCSLACAECPICRTEIADRIFVFT
ncbi:putative armadillo repeat-containing protein 6-like isoform X1 [Capsicum annuum]|uniref:kinesin-like protein KIN-7D, mitochondrial isoform X2 n=1 Tax=Capsicum annuum TaxID=4072 RepID=UPI0007BED461|nr:kinesin-like protein KIN-7D, mitochondrial isoform X2 [Capsicum annuum]KAF3681762.1 putative armadillo repeat-containing protein 6-like isoform X1 [Capsicum annuum]KAF3685668.1 putative armadillo repeat-containing protein 6-like isoform X1 [Capsicum annuum]